MSVAFLLQSAMMVSMMTIAAILAFAKLASQNCLRNLINRNRDHSLPISTLNVHVGIKLSIKTNCIHAVNVSFAGRTSNVRKFAAIVVKNTA
jgi:hypothetical protein